MSNVPEYLCEAVRELLTVLRFPLVPSLQDKWEHVVCDETVGVWVFLLKHCGPSYEICKKRKLVAKMTEEQERKNCAKKAHLRKILARRKELNARCERGVVKVVTKLCHVGLPLKVPLLQAAQQKHCIPVALHAQERLGILREICSKECHLADHFMVESRKAIYEMENKIFLMHCKSLEVEQELNLCNENVDLISRCVCKPNPRLNENTCMDSVTELVEKVKKVVHKGTAMKGRDELVGDDVFEATQILCREVAVSCLWSVFLSILDFTGYQQVERVYEGSLSEVWMSGGIHALEERLNLRAKFLEQVKKVAGMKSDASASKRICLLNKASSMLLKNWFLVQHPGNCKLFSGTVDEFVELSVHREHLISVAKHYVSLLNKYSEDTCDSMAADVEKLMKQKEDLLSEKVSREGHLNSLLVLCYSLLESIRSLTCNGLAELSKHLSADWDLRGLSKLAEEVSGLWTQELDMFLTFPLETLRGINLHRRSSPQLLCPRTLRPCSPLGCPEEAAVPLYSSMVMLPTEAAAIKLANLVACRSARNLEKHSVTDIVPLPISNISELKAKEEEILSSSSEKLECMYQSLLALISSFQENEKNLLFWVSQPLSRVAKTMVVNGRTFEDFKQCRNESTLCKFGSVHSGLDKMKSFHDTFRNRADSV